MHSAACRSRIDASVHEALMTTAGADRQVPRLAGMGRDENRLGCVSLTTVVHIAKIDDRATSIVEGAEHPSEVGLRLVLRRNLRANHCGATAVPVDCPLTVTMLGRGPPLSHWASIAS